MAAQKVSFLTLLAFGSAVLAAAPAAAQPAAIKIAVTASCDQGAPRFEILNVGDLWPEMMMVSLIRMDTKEVITEREMRMRTDQRIVYRAKGAPKEVDVGVKIESKSFKRPPVHDSIVSCAALPGRELSEVSPTRTPN